MIAPTDNDFAIGGDRLYFNKDYIAEEIIGRTNEYLTYNVEGQNITVYSFDSVKCERDIKLLIDAIISDLQTGGTNSTIRNMEKYLDANGILNYIEEELSQSMPLSKLEIWVKKQFVISCMLEELL